MSTNSNMATLVSSDGIEVKATYQAVKQCITLKSMLEILDEEHTTNQPIPVPGVAGDPLEKVMEWCEKHREDPVPKPDDKKTTEPIDALPAWDTEFFKLDKNLIIDITNAANYLEVPLLLQYAVYVIADHLKGKSTEEMRLFLNIENDFTPEQEEKIRQENAWATE
ncbi:s-phase kinase-associated protein 1 [Xylaria castorea]|nr:s-phase kinase-associated protein 1 [Xylaria castorea]